MREPSNISKALSWDWTGEPLTAIAPKHHCAKHGDISAAVTLGIETAEFTYCMLCINEFVAKHCHQATKINPQ